MENLIEFNREMFEEYDDIDLIYRESLQTKIESAIKHSIEEVTNNSKPNIITIQGPGGSGKSTIAKQMKRELLSKEIPCCLFDLGLDKYKNNAKLDIKGLLSIITIINDIVYFCCTDRYFQNKEVFKKYLMYYEEYVNKYRINDMSINNQGNDYIKYIEKAESLSSMDLKDIVFSLAKNVAKNIEDLKLKAIQEELNAFIDKDKDEVAWLKKLINVFIGCLNEYSKEKVFVIMLDNAETINHENFDRVSLDKLSELFSFSKNVLWYYSGRDNLNKCFDLDVLKETCNLWEIDPSLFDFDKKDIVEYTKLNNIYIDGIEIDDEYAEQFYIKTNGNILWIEITCLAIKRMCHKKNRFITKEEFRELINQSTESILSRLIDTELNVYADNYQEIQKIKCLLIAAMIPQGKKKLYEHLKLFELPNIIEGTKQKWYIEKVEQNEEEIFKVHPLIVQALETTIHNRIKTDSNNIISVVLDQVKKGLIDFYRFYKEQDNLCCVAQFLCRFFDIRICFQVMPELGFVDILSDEQFITPENCYEKKFQVLKYLFVSKTDKIQRNNFIHKFNNYETIYYIKDDKMFNNFVYECIRYKEDASLLIIAVNRSLLFDWQIYDYSLNQMKQIQMKFDNIVKDINVNKDYKDFEIPANIILNKLSSDTISKNEKYNISFQTIAIIKDYISRAYYLLKCTKEKQYLVILSKTIPLVFEYYTKIINDENKKYEIILYVHEIITELFNMYDKKEFKNFKEYYGEIVYLLNNYKIFLADYQENIDKENTRNKIIDIITDINIKHYSITKNEYPYFSPQSLKMYEYVIKSYKDIGKEDISFALIKELIAIILDKDNFDVQKEAKMYFPCLDAWENIRLFILFNSNSNQTREVLNHLKQYLENLYDLTKDLQSNINTSKASLLPLEYYLKLFDMKSYFEYFNYLYEKVKFQPEIMSLYLDNNPKYLINPYQLSYDLDYYANFNNINDELDENKLKLRLSKKDEFIRFDGSIHDILECMLINLKEENYKENSSCEYIYKRFENLFTTSKYLLDYWRKKLINNIDTIPNLYNMFWQTCSKYIHTKCGHYNIIARDLENIIIPIYIKYFSIKMQPLNDQNFNREEFQKHFYRKLIIHDSIKAYLKACYKVLGANNISYAQELFSKNVKFKSYKYYIYKDKFVNYCNASSDMFIGINWEENNNMIFDIPKTVLTATNKITRDFKLSKNKNKELKALFLHQMIDNYRSYITFENNGSDFVRRYRAVIMELQYYIFTSKSGNIIQVFAEYYYQYKSKYFGDNDIMFWINYIGMLTDLSILFNKQEIAISVLDSMISYKFKSKYRCLLISKVNRCLFKVYTSDEKYDDTYKNNYFKKSIRSEEFSIIQLKKDIMVKPSINLLCKYLSDIDLIGFSDKEKINYLKNKKEYYLNNKKFNNIDGIETVYNVIDKLIYSFDKDINHFV